MAVYNTNNVPGSVWAGSGGRSNLSSQHVTTPAIPKGSLSERLVGIRFDASYGASKMVYLNPVDAATLIEKCGDWNPMDGNYLKEEADVLYISAMRAGHASYELFRSGLVYAAPHSKMGIIYRTSYSGLKLMEHWGDTFPKFKPYAENCMIDNIVNQITSDCCDLAMGFFPQWMKEEKEAYDERTLNVLYQQAQQARQANILKMYQVQLQNQSWTATSTASNTGMQQSPNQGIGGYVSTAVNKLFGGI